MERSCRQYGDRDHRQRAQGRRGPGEQAQVQAAVRHAVAQLLVLHPDIGPKKARRRAKRLTGARPSKKLLRAADGLGLKEGAEGAVAAAATAGVVKVASVVGEKLKRSVRARRSTVRRPPDARPPIISRTIISRTSRAPPPASIGVQPSRSAGEGAPGSPRRPPAPRNAARVLAQGLTKVYQLLDVLAADGVQARAHARPLEGRGRPAGRCRAPGPPQPALCRAG